MGKGVIVCIHNGWMGVSDEGEEKQSRMNILISLTNNIRRLILVNRPPLVVF